MENNNAKHFVIQLGSLLSLYVSVSFLLVLLFNIYNLVLPSDAESYWEIESAVDSVRLGIAMVVVFFPTYLVLTRLVHQIRRNDETARYHGLTKWLVYLSLLLGGAVLLGDVVAVLLSFLNGELTTRFILKAFTLLSVIGLAFFYYLREAQGYWLAQTQASLLWAGTTSLIVLTSVIFGTFHIDTPQAARELRLDEAQIADLTNIEWRIIETFETTGQIPQTLEEAFTGRTVPTAPEERPAYTYTKTASGYELCATFSRDAQEQSGFAVPIQDIQQPIEGTGDWYYTQGNYCFMRIVTAQ